MLINENVFFLLSDPNPPLDITTENKNIISNEAVSFRELSFDYSLPRERALTKSPLLNLSLFQIICPTIQRAMHLISFPAQDVLQI